MNFVHTVETTSELARNHPHTFTFQFLYWTLIHITVVFITYKE